MNGITQNPFWVWHLPLIFVSSIWRWWPGWEGGAHDFGTGGRDGDDDDGGDGDSDGDYDDGGGGDGGDDGDDDQVGREGRTTLGRGGKEFKARQLTSVPSEKDSQLNNS